LSPQTTDWTDKITEGCVNRLKQASPAFKYCVSVVLAQRGEGGGSGLHSEVAVLYDPATDGSCTLVWENDSIACIATIFGLAL
jgi:dynein light chain Tctex-type 1